MYAYRYGGNEWCLCCEGFSASAGIVYNEETLSTMIKTAKRRAYERLYHKKYSKLPKNKAWAQNYQLVRYYGISVMDYRVLFDRQNGRCAICSRHQSEFSKRLSVDHDHKTRKVCGLLCAHCNGVILQVVENYSDLVPLAQNYLTLTKTSGE